MPSLPVPEFVRPWLGSSPQAAALFYAVALGLTLAAALGLWLAFGRGPRRRRAYRHAIQALQAGDWKQALAEVRDLQRGRVSPAWRERLSKAEAASHRAAGAAFLQEKEY